MNNWIKTIFRHDTPQGGVWYSVAVLGKDQAGEKQYEYWPVDFPQGTDIADRAKIEFKDFYISFYTRNDGTVQHKFVVQDFLLQGGSAVYPQQRQQQGYQQPAMNYGDYNTPQYQQQGWNNGWRQPGPQYPQPPQVQTNQPVPQPNVVTTAQNQQPDFEQLNEDVPF